MARAEDPELDVDGQRPLWDDPWLLRQLVSQGRERFLSGNPEATIRDVIRASWRRSRARLSPDQSAAPVEDRDLREEWHFSPLREPVSRLGGLLTHIAGDGDLIVAVTDPWGKILWTYSDHWMLRRAERVNFVPGGRWDEASMGTNALDLALRTGRPQTVFSAEHFTSAVEEWVCYSAPIVDPTGKRILGVLDLSTTWNRALPIGVQVAEMAAGHLSELIGGDRGVGRSLEVRTLGPSQVRLGGKPMSLPPRQIEILAILALHPEGLTLDALHSHLYRDLSVSPTTCKAEVSKLRQALGGGISSRPYRLSVPVYADHVEIADLLRHGRIEEALRLFRGDLLPDSEAPELVEHRHLITTAMREAVLASGDPELLVALSDRVPEDLELHERGLALLGDGDPRRSLLEARRRLAAR